MTVVTEANPVVTRSGRVSKQPNRLEPTEDVCDDDYSEDEYDTDYNSEDDDLCETESDDECVDSDEDENGNLRGFIVSDNDESDDEYEA